MEGPAPRAAQPGQPLSLSSRSSLGPAVRSSRPEPASASRQHQRLCRARTHGSPASLPRLLTAPCVLCFLKLFGIVLTRTLQIKEGKQHFLNQQRPLGGVHWGHEPLKSPAETGSASASLSPEEQRVLERKRKKERKKEARRRLREAGVAAAPSPAVRRSGAALALQYLRSWAQKHEDWRFQKTRQTWLLSHMYDRDQVPDKHFPALLAYLEGLRGRARELTVQKAEALMRELDEAGAGALPPGGTQRARQVLQLLS
nr:uncharacterized protein C7orf50 homolog isoform X2 [Ovis aries]